MLHDLHIIKVPKYMNGASLSVIIVWLDKKASLHVDKKNYI